MCENTSNSYSISADLSDEATWNHLYSALRSRTRYLVYSFVLPSWRGQEEDIIEDIVQETLRRLIERAHKSERGEAPPIQSAEHIMMIIAQNYCTDLRRRDRRVIRIIPSDHSVEVHQDTSEQAHPFDSGTENVYQEKLFEIAAREIANFPDKQRTALLIDLANRMSFATHITPLQKAFLSIGIQLQQYQRPIPSSPLERTRHFSLLSYAYKRVAHLPCIQAYTAVA
jgi:DNA-directed RNA polymerase specialized sigma24 family protein